jgi:nitrite reductase/ring-hydroxylating ferredoxin subunit
MTAPEPDLIALCRASDLTDGGEACPFDVRYQGQTCRAFALRWKGRVYAYLNRCSHVAMEMDWRPNRFFDLTGQHIVCASHGALFRPDTGQCVGGPGRGPLVRIEAVEREGVVFWRTQYNLQAIEF